jgi:hypothetical protein
MKPDSTKQLFALHAQASAMVAQLEAIIDAENTECQHENAVDIGTMGMAVGERMHCNDCGETFSRIEE